jgi:FG-GAP repeat/Prealbumin-like fold domain
MTSEAHTLAQPAGALDRLTEAARQPTALRRLARPAALAGALLALVLLTLSAGTQEAQRTSPSARGAGLQAIPLAARPLVSRTLGRDQVSYAVHRTASGLVARNTGQRLTARFGEHGVHVRAGSDTLALRLRAAGYGQALAPVAAAVPTEQANRVSYPRGLLTEWYANGPLGLEQGFTVKAPPAGTRTGPLTLALSLSLSGSLRPALEPGAKSLRFADSSLRYTGLTAFDARGTKLPARLELQGQTLLIKVDDAGARYPLTIDPFVQLAKLTNSSPLDYDGLGSSVAIAGDTIVVGASGGAAPLRYVHPGAAYVFVKPAAGWANATQTARLAASDSSTYNHFGGSVAIAGDSIVVGAAGALTGIVGRRGAAYVFVKPAGGWANGTETAKLTSEFGGRLGVSVAISGDTIVAGTSDGGAAYVFVKPAGGWTNGTQTARLTASDGPYDYFGLAVAVSGDTVVVGAPSKTVSGNSQQGAVYVFVEPAGGWASGTETAKLTTSDGAAHDLLGPSVAISGDSIVAGAPFADISGNVDEGAAYVFVKPAGGWASGTETAKLTASDGAAVDHFGNPVAALGGMIVAGAPDAEVSGHFDGGAAYVFVKPAAGWANATQTAKLTSSDGRARDHFGRSVGASGRMIVAGAVLADVSGHVNAGAAYVFWRAPASIGVTKDLIPASAAGRFDLKVAGTVVKAGAGDGGSGATGVVAGTYRVTESAAAGTSLSDYSTSIACTINGNPGPSAHGTTQLDVTVATGDQAVCTITNKRKAQVTLTKHLVPASDPGRFDLKLSSNTSNLVRVVKSSAGDGDSGSIQVAPGSWTVLESPATGTSLSDYTSSIVCTRNGNPGPSGNGASLPLTLSPADVLVCTFTNQRK